MARWSKLGVFRVFLLFYRAKGGAGRGGIAPGVGWRMVCHLLVGVVALSYSPLLDMGGVAVPFGAVVLE